MTANQAEHSVDVGRKHIERLMIAKGSRVVSCCKLMATTEGDPHSRHASDLVDRNFSADAPKVLWS